LDEITSTDTYSIRFIGLNNSYIPTGYTLTVDAYDDVEEFNDYFKTGIISWSYGVMYIIFIVCLFSCFFTESMTLKTAAFCILTCQFLSIHKQMIDNLRHACSLKFVMFLLSMFLLTRVLAFSSMFYIVKDDYIAINLMKSEDSVKFNPRIDTTDVHITMIRSTLRCFESYSAYHAIINGLKKKCGQIFSSISDERFIYGGLCSTNNIGVVKRHMITLKWAIEGEQNFKALLFADLPCDTLKSLVSDLIVATQ